MKNHRTIIEPLLSTAGVRIDGPDPWDIQVRDEGFYGRVMKDGSLGLGESYMEGGGTAPGSMNSSAAYYARNWSRKSNQAGRSC